MNLIADPMQHSASLLPGRRKPRRLAAALLAAFGFATASPGNAELRFEHLVDASVELSHYGGKWIAVADFTGDGLDDLMMGGDDQTTLSKTPIFLFASNGDGTLVNVTRRYLPRSARAAWPIGLAGDFNGDGRPDAVMLDVGHGELGYIDNIGPLGEVPRLFLSRAKGRFKTSKALEKAVQAGERRAGWWDDPDGRLHAKALSAGDIDLDGDLDLFVESGGGYRNLPPHFLINLGNGRYFADIDESRLIERIKGTPSWRYFANTLADLDGDGYPDLVMGQKRRRNNDQEGLRSVIVFNDGAGNFEPENAVPLRLPRFNGGWTDVMSLAAGDIDGDGDLDLVLAHTRSQSVSPPDLFLTGRFLQVLVNKGNRRFKDETKRRIGRQKAWESEVRSDGFDNHNFVKSLRLIDIDADGSLDLFMGGSEVPKPESPLIHLNNGRGVFSVVDPSLMSPPDTCCFGEEAMPIDLNGDGLVDFVHADWTPGADGEFGTEDDGVRVVPSLQLPD